MTRNPIKSIYKALTEGNQTGNLKGIENYHRIQYLDKDEYRFYRYYHWMI